jgi:hypothetical protein
MSEGLLREPASSRKVPNADPNAACLGDLTGAAAASDTVVRSPLMSLRTISNRMGKRPGEAADVGRHIRAAIALSGLKVGDMSRQTSGRRQHERAPNL